MATKRARKRPKTCETISPRTKKRCRAVPMKAADPDGKYRCVGHSTSDRAEEVRQVARVSGRAANGVNTPGAAKGLAAADLDTPEAALEVMRTGIRELGAKNLSPQELDAVTRAAKAALEWHGRTERAPKGAEKTEATVGYVEDGAEEEPAPAGYDEVVEIGVDPPPVGVQ